MELTLEQALQKGVEAHRAGKIQEADRYYTAILKANPKHPDANHNMGVLAVGIGKVEEALPFFKTALDVNPKTDQYWLSYIDALIKLGRMADAKDIFEQAKTIRPKCNDFQHLEKKLYGSKVSSNWDELSENQDPPTEVLQTILNLYKDGNLQQTFIEASSLLSKFPKSSALLNVLGVTNASLGKIDDAIGAYKRAIHLKPTNAEAYNNMAITLRKQGKSDEALEAYKKAILIDPNYAEAYNNMGVDLHNDGNLEEAIAAYTKALFLKHDYPEALNNMGNTLKLIGKTENAIEYYSKALLLNPKYSEAAYNLANVLKTIEFHKPNQSMQQIIALILDQNTVVRPKDIFFAAKSLLKLEPSLKELIIATSKKNQTMQVINSVKTLSNLPLLLKLMKLCPLSDIDLETVLRKVRLGLLKSVSEISDKSELLSFQSALAVQCFINEYIYPESEVETHALKKLENIVEREMRQGIKPSPNTILCLASYRPLNEYSWHNLLSFKDNITEVLQIQVVEPELELSYAGQLPVLKKISNKVSSKVRKQYEVNPYPRWIKSELFLEPRSISTVIKEINLRIFDYNIHKVNAPNILIAGCGTGQHSINTASRFSGSKVLAIDLSLSSLAYAKRRAELLNISNIEHMQADILDLTKVNEEFDVVESSGVLHHMADPFAGWKVLTDCLKPGGLMKIGLYSKLARQDIKKLRKEIAQLGIQANKKEMRNFREMLIKSKRKDHKNIFLSSDFFSLSEFRDLLFHVEEHTFTIPEIKKILTALGLKFCGFEDYTILSHFKQTNSKRDYLYDLGKWHAYEKANPRAFSGMYQFWCQKVA